MHTIQATKRCSAASITGFAAKRVSTIAFYAQRLKCTFLTNETRVLRSDAWTRARQRWVLMKWSCLWLHISSPSSINESAYRRQSRMNPALHEGAISTTIIVEQACPKSCACDIAQNLSAPRCCLIKFGVDRHVSIIRNHPNNMCCFGG